MINGLISALRTLTLLPVPGKDAAKMSDALPWFPLVGCFLGVLVWGIARIFGFLFSGWDQGAAAIAVLAGVVLTRGLHLDGLADWMDGLGGGRGNRDRILAVMKDSHVGAFGVMALVMILLLKWVAMTHLMSNHAFGWVISAYIISRTAMAELAVCLPYARTEGGTAGPFVHTARPWHRYAAWTGAIFLLFALYGPFGSILFIFGGILTWLAGLWFYQRLGGITGDLLGAGAEIVETGTLYFCVFWLQKPAFMISWKVFIEKTTGFF